MEQHNELELNTAITTKYVRGIYEGINTAMETLKKVHAHLTFYSKEDWVENIIEELARRTVNSDYLIVEQMFTVSRMFVTKNGMCISTSVSYPIKEKIQLIDFLDPLEILKRLTEDVIDPIFMAELGETNSYYNCTWNI